MRGKVAKPLLLTTLHVRSRKTEEKKTSFHIPGRRLFLHSHSFSSRLTASCQDDSFDFSLEAAEANEKGEACRRSGVSPILKPCFPVVAFCVCLAFFLSLPFTIFALRFISQRLQKVRTAFIEY